MRNEEEEVGRVARAVPSFVRSGKWVVVVVVVVVAVVAVVVESAGRYEGRGGVGGMMRGGWRV